MCPDAIHDTERGECSDATQLPQPPSVRKSRGGVLSQQKRVAPIISASKMGDLTVAYWCVLASRPPPHVSRPDARPKADGHSSAMGTHPSTYVGGAWGVQVDPWPRYAPPRSLTYVRAADIRFGGPRGSIHLDHAAALCGFRLAPTSLNTFTFAGVGAPLSGGPRGGKPTFFLGPPAWKEAGCGVGKR